MRSWLGPIDSTFILGVCLKEYFPILIIIKEDILRKPIHNLYTNNILYDYLKLMCHI